MLRKAVGVALFDQLPGSVWISGKLTHPGTKLFVTLAFDVIPKLLLLLYGELGKPFFGEKAAVTNYGMVMLTGSSQNRKFFKRQIVSN